ncbi:MAG TPA: hypothetical protein VK745_33045 [Polyangiaceae bacterium]|jgi:hypothetical protein|nr:hypothetical protein [Polyangiaceae bacterium]
MTLRGLARVLLAYALALVVLSLILWRALRLDRTRAPSGTTIVSLWRGGTRVARSVVTGQAEHVLGLESAVPGSTRSIEQIVDSAPILALNRLVFAASVAPVRDGVSVSYQGRTAYVTPDDLLKIEAYESNLQLGPLQLVLGVDPDKVLASLAGELKTTPDELFRHGSFRRFAVRGDQRFPRRLKDSDVSLAEIKNSVQSAARYLARNQKRDGSFRYEVNAMTGGDAPDYNYPRHAGATYFLARAGNQLKDQRLFRAARQAGAFMKDHATLRCGAHSCVGEGDEVDIGSASLALLAYVELLNGGASEFRDAALDLAAFLRSQQLPSGDFQHFYSVKEQHAINLQVEYYTGEAAFALSRVARISQAAQDLDGARRGLAFLVARPALFLGAHYFWGAEHWTCQVLEDLWQRAPDRRALQFCLDWQAANRNMQYTSPPERPEYDGALSRGPFVSPRLTPLASRLEAAVATLAVARSAGIDAAQLALLEAEIRRGFGFLLRYQFSPGPSYLMPDPRALVGGVPGSPVDLHVRIDYPQHAGDAWLRYLELVEVR